MYERHVMSCDDGEEGPILHRQPRHPTICLGTFPRSQPSCSTHEVQWRNLLRIQIDTMRSRHHRTRIPMHLRRTTSRPNPSTKIVNWGPCNDVSDVRAFLGTISVCRLFIQNFARRAY